MIGGVTAQSHSKSCYLVAAMLARFRRRIGLIGVLAVFFVSGAHGPANSASTDNCLAAPNTPAPEGSHWFYRIDLQSTVKCWYLRMTGQTEQKTSAPDKPATSSRAPALHATSSHAAAAHATSSHAAASHVTASHVAAPNVSASRVQLIRRSSSSILGAEPPGNEASATGNDGTSPALGAGSDAPSVALQSRASVGAPADKTFARIAPEDSSSSSIEVIRVRNSNEIPVGDQADAPRAPIRVVWPSPISEVRPAPAVSKVDAKDQSALLVRPEADATVSADAQSAAEPSEEASGASRVGKLAVLIFLAFGLSGAGMHAASNSLRTISAEAEPMIGAPRTSAARAAPTIGVRPTGSKTSSAGWLSTPKPVRRIRLLRPLIPFNRVRTLLT